jgi:type IV pilus assembly protein PilC
MALFLYRVKDDYGRTLHGLIEADTASDVKQNRRNEEYYFLSVAPFSKKILPTMKVDLRTLSMFTHRLMSLVEAGIPILGAMQILWRQTEGKTIQIAVSHIKAQLEDGHQISAAMDDFPKIFPLVYRSLIRVGEMSGSLVPILKKLTEYLDYQLKVIERTNRATMYPTMVIIFSFLVVIGMFAFVVPTFQKVLLKLNVELPALTKAVLWFSSLIRSPWFIISALVFGILAVVLFKIFKKDPRVAYQIDKAFLKMPYFGSILYLFSLSQVTRCLSILLGAGVPIIDSLDVASTTAGNTKIVADLEEIKVQVEQGGSLYDSFQKNKDFPVMLVEMVGIGETSGSLIHILEKVTKHFDEEVDYELNRFLTLLEPMLIIIVGVLVVVTLLAIYLPVISIWQGLMNR